MPTVNRDHPHHPHSNGLLAAAQVSDRLGICRQRLYQLRTEERFPEPDELVGSKALWRWKTILDWGIETGRLTPKGQKIRLKGGRPVA